MYSCKCFCYNHVLSPCTHDGADMRMFTHVKEAVNKGCSNISNRATDMDIIVIDILFRDMGATQLWLNYGTQKHLRIIPSMMYRRASRFF